MNNPAQPNEAAQASDRRNLLQSALQALETMEAKLAAAEKARTEPIAIVGMSCRFPGGVDSPESLWQLLREGRDAVTSLPPDRVRIAESLGVSPFDADGKPIWWGGFLDNIDQFDPQFFGITPREALSMDPQHRLLLEVAWEALERAGQAPDQLGGSSTGVFVGISTNDYGSLVRQGGYETLDAYAATGGSMNVAAGRIAFTLGLQGPCIAVDTACSSSLVAVHLAVQSLRNRECRMALAGGVNAVLMPDGFVTFRTWGMMASDGHCKSFDASADGFVRAEGCGLIVCKRLSDAIADGDTILAVIRGTAVNQDGRSSGLTVPNGPAQQAMLRQALANSGIQPADVQYIEAHGTGTAIGDPIEVEAIGAVLGQGRSNEQPLFLSSIKTNLGHPESAAGIAGLIKVILSMQHGEIAPHLHLRERSPKIPWPEFPIDIPTEPTPWHERNGVRIAGVSGFGFSGTNAHVVLTSYPAQEPAQASSQEPSQAAVPARHLLTLSARSEAALSQMATNLADFLTRHPDAALADAAYTANTGRAQLAHRLALVGESTAQAAERLAAFAASGKGASVVSGQIAAGNPARVAFLFTGQGAQYAGMGESLYESAPVFRAALDRCAALLATHVDVPLLDLLFGTATDRLDQTMYTQPALFCLEYALSELWRSWGVVPNAVMGHSVGEYVAAVVAGVMSLEDGIALIAARGRLMQSLPAGGTMAAIFAPVAQVEAALVTDRGPLAIAAINGPEHTVISGAAGAVDAVVEQFALAGTRTQKLVVSHAFHSALMDPILDAFERLVAGITLRKPRIALISNLSGEPCGDEITTPAYWRRHLREAVRFNAGIEALLRHRINTFIEVGPQPTLLGMAQTTLAAAEDASLSVPSLRKGRDDMQQMLGGLGALFVRGAAVDLAALYGAARHRKIALPTYPFQRSRYWVDLPSHANRLQAKAGGAIRAYGEHPLLGRRSRSPLLREVLFESQISAHAPPYLADHDVNHAILYPGTAYLEMALAAAASLGSAPYTVSSLNILNPLALDEKAYTLQIVLTPDEDEQTTLQIIGYPSDQADADQEKSMRVHATGMLDLTGQNASPTVTQVDLATLRANLPEEVDVDAMYSHLRSLDLHYGPSFLGLEQMWRRDGAALGFVRLPEAAGSANGYQIHPALLDACFHTIAGAQRGSRSGLPVGVSGLHVYEPVPDAVWCYTQVLPSGVSADRGVSCRLQLFDEQGTLVAEIDRLEVLAITQDDAQMVADWMHHVVWRAQPVQAETEQIPEPGRWLIVTDAPDCASELADQITRHGQQAIIAHPATATNEIAADTWQFNPAEASALRTLLDAASADTELAGVICLWSEPPATEATTLDTLWAREELLSRSSLQLVQALADRANPARLWLVTAGAQRVVDAHTPVNAADATLWGFGRVVALEHPALQCTNVDLDPAAISASLSALAADLRNAGNEDQIAFRGDTRYVARLNKLAAPQSILPAQTPYRLALPKRGVLSNLTYEPLDVPTPGAGEVTIEVHATGLNFRDVLNVLGMYPGDPGAPGIECAGVITAVGAGVTNLKVGDPVVGLAGRSFDAVVVTPANYVARKPESLSFAEAVTIPSTFLTAWYGLVSLAQLKSGQRVLIHAAAGGVGLAAVQIAQQMGAEVFATAGSPAKHAHLRARGVQHIFSSRTADFLDKIMQLTDGKGVDVVLNSLSEEFITQSFHAMTDDGCFLEIGKRGIWSTEQAAEVRPNARYIPYDLGDVLRDDPEAIQTMLTDLLASIDAGSLAALPLHAFTSETIVDAFRFMSQAKHIGKVVITHRPSAWNAPVRADGVYLVTGGLGGIGLQVAKWLVDEGAQHVVLVGRSAPRAATRELIAEMQETGANILVIAADVAQPDAVAGVLQQLANLNQPLRGVFHAAGSLDDGIVQQQTWERFVPVLAPKLAGAWNLHTQIHGAALDYFVLFSSGSALLGNAGQANYAAANAYLDALAHARHAQGLAAQSINWGAWADVGMAAALAAGQQQQMAGRGVKLIAPQAGIHALARILHNGDTQTAVLPIHWASVLEQFPEGAQPPFLAELARSLPARPRSLGKRTDDVAIFRKDFAGSDAETRFTLLMERIIFHINQVMGTEIASDDVQHALSDIGLDSLMAVELKNRIDLDLRISVPVTLLLAQSSIGDLPAQILPMVRTLNGGEAAQANGSATPLAVEQVQPAEVPLDVDQLSDADVDAMLKALLADGAINELADKED